MRNSRRSVLVTFALTVAVVVGSVSSAQARLPPPCDPANPPTCLYTSDLDFTPGIVDGIVLVDPDRGDYPIPLLVRYPVGASDKRPVVIWNHGGAPSAGGKNRSAEWGETLARAGYVVIHPSRVVPDVDPLPQDCQDNGFTDPAECAFFMANMRFGPQNTHFIIDHLADVEDADPVLDGLLNDRKIVVAGHSAGTTTVLANAGASQQWVEGGPVYNEEDDAPIAFLATGPQGPQYAGFNAGFDEVRSFVDITRPFLFVTGVGDETGEPVPTRLTAFFTMQPRDKGLVWDTQAEAVHETMDIDKCDTELREEHCLWIASVGVAYVDAVARKRKQAIKWLASDAFEVATRGEIELHRR